MSQNCGSFYCFFFKRFFFFLTLAEMRAFNRLKALSSALSQPKKKKSAFKEPVKRNAILRHVNRLIVFHNLQALINDKSESK